MPSGRKVSCEPRQIPIVYRRPARIERTQEDCPAAAASPVDRYDVPVAPAGGDALSQNAADGIGAAPGRIAHEQLNRPGWLSLRRGTGQLGQGNRRGCDDQTPAVQMRFHAAAPQYR